jgi:hypothetical protein
MDSRKTRLALSSLVVVQVLAAISLITAGTSAQSEQLVAVLVAEKSRDVCEVQYRKKVDVDDWNATGSPEACQGGIVTTSIMAQEEVDSQVVQAESSAATESVRTIPLTGNEAEDEAAINAEVIAIHQSLDPGVTAANEDLLGFMAPDALATFR